MKSRQDVVLLREVANWFDVQVRKFFELPLRQRFDVKIEDTNCREPMQSLRLQLSHEFVVELQSQAMLQPKISKIIFFVLPNKIINLYPKFDLLEPKHLYGDYE